jgi:putative oxidoreductase
MATKAGYEGYAYALMRFMVGFLFMFHGLQKILGLYGGQAVPMLSRLWVAGIIELVGGVLVMAGLFTVPVAFICSGEMAAAYFLGHYPKAFWPILNGGELAAIYSFVFLYIASRGGGPLSMDRLVRRKG